MNDFIINLLHNISIASVYIIIFLGIISFFALVVFIASIPLNYLWKSSKSAWWIIQYVIHRKEFKKWHISTKQ